MKPKPHPAGQGGFPLGHLRKSYMSHGLNKTTRTYGGQSGYDSTARKVTANGRFKTVGKMSANAVVKTIIHTNGKRISKNEFIPRGKAFSFPFTSKVEYLNKWGDKMTVMDMNMR